jgi:hypothetical protein
VPKIDLWDEYSTIKPCDSSVNRQAYAAKSGLKRFKLDILRQIAAEYMLSRINREIQYENEKDRRYSRG